MNVVFQTKNESNLEQERYFLSLSPGERFSYWLRLLSSSQIIPSKHTKEKKNNFLIVIESLNK